MLPETLQQIITDANYPESDLYIQKLDISTDPLKLEFIIHDTEGSGGETSISMTAFGCIDFYLDRESWSGYIHMAEDHPLLWKFTDVQSTLYMSGGRPEKIEHITLELFKIHNSLFDKYARFDLRSLKILDNGYGLLQSGAKKLLTAFADILEKNSVAFTIIGDRVPREATLGLKILFLGDSYFIAERFEFEKITI